MTGRDARHPTSEGDLISVVLILLVQRLGTALPGPRPAIVMTGRDARHPTSEGDLISVVLILVRARLLGAMLTVQTETSRAMITFPSGLGLMIQRTAATNGV